MLLHALCVWSLLYFVTSCQPPGLKETEVMSPTVTSCVKCVVTDLQIINYYKEHCMLVNVLSWPDWNKDQPIITRRTWSSVREVHRLKLPETLFLFYLKFDHRRLTALHQPSHPQIGLNNRPEISQPPAGAPEQKGSLCTVNTQNNSRLVTLTWQSKKHREKISLHPIHLTCSKEVKHHCVLV